jgi:hypothetical protein
MGMLAGSLVVSYISTKWATWTAMVFLLAIHLGTNYLAVRAVCMQTLNRQRANLVFSSLLEQLDNDETNYNNDRNLSRDDLPRFVCPSPEDVRLQERVFERDGRADSATGSHKGPQLDELSKLLHIFKDGGYIVWYDQWRSTFLVVLEEGAGPVTMLKAWMFALHFAKYGKIKDGGSVIEVLERTRSHLARVEDDIIQQVAKQWDLEVSAMETHSGTRIRMRNDKR